MSDLERSVEILCWQDVSERVRAVNPKLADIIDKINPSKQHKIIKVNYLFGDLMVKDGQICLPLDSGLIEPITSNAIDKNIRKGLLYSPIPLALVIGKKCEVFVNADQRAIPLNVISPGNLFGTFELMNYFSDNTSKPIWNVSAGSRTIFMLPRITDSSGLKRLCIEFGIPATTRLQHLTDHWQIFKYIVNQEKFDQDWVCEVLYFTEDWFKHTTDTSWLRLYNYFFQAAWGQSERAINKDVFGLIWQNFSKAITSRNLRPRQYLVDTIKHLFLIGNNSASAIIPAAYNQQLYAPIDYLQKAFVDVYLLKNYLPTIMHAVAPGILDCKNHVYYSLSFPTLLEGVPDDKSSSTIMLDIKDIKLLIDTLKERSIPYIQNLMAKKIDFQYFHIESDMTREINSSVNLINEDTRLTKDADIYPGRSSCTTSPFWRGAIKIINDDV